ncbi:kinesin, putative, (fragment), partial [Trypanosoma brucei gambiense DAL972]
MLHKPCVQVVMRFRPNPGVASPFYSTDDTGAPWLTYDERTVRVVERDPPMDRKRVEPNGGPCGDSNDPPVSKALVPAPVTSYTFDAVLSDTSTQRDVHKCIGEPVIGNVLKGYNATIFSYGQTGSGKTYTMLGPYGGLADAFFEDSPFYGERGLVPRVVEELFNRLNTMKSEEYTWRVKTQMFEIYRENIVDLLIEGDQQPQTEYRIREGKNSQGSFCMYVDSLKEVECRTAADFMDILQRGVASRHTRETGTNDRSSRSHCLLCLFVELKHNEDYSMWTESRLNFVDLAGSERVATSQAEGETLKETQYINLSLSLLGNVIHRLAGGNTGHIPYRDTKLTRVLKDSLGGNSLTTLLCHGTTEAATKTQTINTLRFAQKALRIKTRAVVNKPSKTTIKQQQQEFYKEHTKQLEKQIRVLQEIIRSRENTEGENSMCTKCESMSAAIASLTKEIERLQKELIAREEQLQQTQETGDYYKKNCETLENELAKLTEEQEANDARHIEAYTILEEESENLRAEIEALQKQLAEKPHKDASNSEALSNKNNTRKNNYNDYKNRATMTDRRTHSNCCTMTDPVAIVMPDVMEDMQRRLTKELINCGTMTDIRSHSNCCTMTDPVAIVMPDVMEDMQRRLTKELINCGTMTDIRSHSNCCTMTDPVAIVMPDVMEDMQRRLTKELINCGTMTDIRSHSNCCTMTDPVAIVMPDVMEDMQRRLTKELINCGTMTDIRSHSNCCIMTDPVAIVMPDVMEDMQRRLTKELINCGTMTDGTISTNRATMTDRRTHSNCCIMTDPVAIVMPDVMEDMQRRLTKELINCGTMTDGTISTNRATMTDRRTHSNCCIMTDPVAIVMPDVMEDMQRRLTKELINCGTMTDGTISTNRATMTDRRTHSNCCTMTDPVAIVMPDVMEDMQRRDTKELINCGTMTDLRSHSNCGTMTDPVAIVMPDVMEDMQRRLTKEFINCGTMTDIRSHSNCCTMTDPVAIVMPDVMEDMQRRLTKELINCGTMTDGTISTNRATMTDRRTHSNCCIMTDPVAIVMPDVMEDMQRRLTKELINCGTMTDGTISTNRATMTDRRTHSNCCTMTDPVAIVMPDVMEDMQRRLTKELINCGTMTDIRSHSNCCTMTDPVAIVMPDVMEDMQRRLTKELINCGTMTDIRSHSNCCTMTDPVAIVMPDVMEDMQRRLTKELINCGTMTDIRSHSNCCTMTDPVAIVMPDVMEDMQRRLTKELINCGTMTDIRSHSNCCTMTDPVAIVMPDVMEDMQRRLTKELINCGTMTDIRSHSNCCTMTDPVAIVMPDVMEDMQRRLTKELINCGTMTDIRSHSNCCTMTDPVAIVMPDVMEDMQRRLTKELINCGTMTDIRSHSNCCIMTDPVAIVMPDVMEDMQRRLTKELINCGTMTDGTISTNRGTMTDRRTHSNCCTMTDPVAIVMPDVMEDMQRRLTKELINCGTMTDGTVFINCGTMTDRRTHSNCCTMTDPVAIVMPDVMEDMQRRLTKELINCGTMTDIRSHSNCCTMTDPVAIVMPDVMEDMQRRLTKELINCGTMTDIRSHSNCCTMTDPVAIVMPDVMEDMQRRLTKELINCGTMTDGTISTNRATMTDRRTHSNCCTMTDPVAIVMPDVMEDMQRRLTKELINCGTMTDIRSHSNCCTMTDPVAIVMPDVMEDMQRRLTKELINCGTMTDIRSHSNCCTMTDPVAIVMPDVMEDMQRRLTKELINCGTMTDGTVSTNRATMTEVCRQSNSLDRRVSCVSGTAENVSLSGETFCRNTSVNTRECSYIARNTIFASSVVSSFVPVIGEGQFEWWCLDDVYAHALLFSYCNPRDVGINIGLFDDCDDKVLLQSLGVVHRTLGSIRADYDGSVVSVIRRFLVQQRGALAGDGALEGCVPCEALFEGLISARNALLVEPMVSNSSTVKGEDRVCHGDGEGALDSCLYAHLQVAMTAVFSIARERGGYLSDIFASVKV